MEPSRIIGYVFFALLVIWIARLATRRKAEFWAAIKGEDNKLQAVEIGLLIWFIFFPVLLVCEVFLQLYASEKVWYSMDGIFVALVLGDLGQKYIETRK
jgi:hypothetical protein